MAELEEQIVEKNLSKKQIIMIAGGGILLALSLGIGVTFLLMKPSSPKEEPAAAKEEKVEAASHKEAGSHKDGIYYDMEKPVVVDFPAGSPAKHGRVTIAMLVESAETVEALKKNDPMIRNNLLMLISSQDAVGLYSREGKDALRKAILDDVNAVLTKMAGKGQVDEILFTSFVMQ